MFIKFTNKHQLFIKMSKLALSSYCKVLKIHTKPTHSILKISGYKSANIGLGQCGLNYIISPLIIIKNLI